MENMKGEIKMQKSGGAKGRIKLPISSYNGRYQDVIYTVAQKQRGKYVI